MAQYELELIDYWFILKKRKYLILFSAGLVLLFTFAFSTFLQPAPLYETFARVKFDRSSTVAQQLLESLTVSSPNDLASQTEFIRSFPVMERVGHQLNIIQADAPPEVRKSAPYLSAIYDLSQQVRAAREADTNIIKITTAGENPEFIAELANATAEAYRLENIATRNRLVTESRRFVEDQLGILERKLTDAENALLRFKEREGQVFLADEAKAALDAYTKLEGELDSLLRVKEETKRQIEMLKAPDGSGIAGERIFTEEPLAHLGVLNSKLMDLIQERATALLNYLPEHPQVQELTRKIANVKREMLGELQSKTNTLILRETALKEQIGQYRGRYLAFPKAAIILSRLERDVKVNSDLYSALKVKHQELLIKSAERIEEVTIITPATKPGAPMNAPNNSLNLMVGSLMGVFLGIVLAFARESFDTSIGTIEGVEDFLKVPVLGVIPQFDDKELLEVAKAALPPNTPREAIESLSRLICFVDPKSVLSESLRSLRTNIQFASMDRRVKSILFTSAGLGEGKSTSIVNLAITLAQEGQRVLLVDADLRRPIVHQRLGLEREPGLTDALLGTVPWSRAVRSATDLMLGKIGVDRVVNSPGLDNLSIMTSGSATANPSECLNLNKIKNLIGEMQEQYDLVLFDTPPILPVTDAVAISSRVDGTILVYQVGRIGRNALRRAKFLLDHAQANIMGVVLTNVRAEVTPESVYYRYDYR
jgi:capsular exopolysaccharide synthesis family protein